jgi:DNA-binding transcriptional MocR family regulator
VIQDAQITMESTLPARVARQIMDAAEQGTYKPSERLPSERELAEQLMVSRTTVTAAYLVLEQQGLIRRIHGKGAYLCALPVCEEAFSWSGKISRFANALDEPVLELLARRCADQVPCQLSVGTPSLEIFPGEQYAGAVRRVLETSIPSALAVAPTEGQWALRTTLGGWLEMPPENIMITAGAQESIDLLARCLVEPGDFVIVDSPTYPGALQSFLSAGARLLSWNVGWSLGQLEDLLLRFRPKLIFTIPTFQNPTGRVMTLKTRLALLDLAKRYRIPIVEDDVYGRTSFGSHPVPSSLYNLDKGSHVIHLSTFSKMLAPGLRIGWLTAPLYMIKQLALIKMRSNLFTGGLNQLVLADMITHGQMDQHLERLRQHHRSLCAAATDAIMPSVKKGLVSCRAPAGGLYLWCKLGFAADEERLLALLDTRGVSVAPGAAFRPERGREAVAAFRLCFTAVSRETLVQGIHILNRTLEEFRSEAQASHISPPCSSVLENEADHLKARAS